MERQLPQLQMLLDLSKLDLDIQMPEGYEFINAPGDAKKVWTRIINNTFAYGFSFDDFEKEMGEIPNGSQDLFLFIKAPNGEMVGTGAVELKQEGRVANLHYIAVEPEHGGKRLGYLISKQLLINAKSKGAIFATLQTDDYRIPAIKTYLKLGFRPLLVHPNQVDRCNKLIEEVGEWSDK